MQIPRSWSLVEYAEIDSTNLEAARLISQGGLMNGTVLFAHRQTKGKGTHGKEWSSPSGNLYTTLVLRAHKIENPHQLSLVMALAVRDALIAAAGENPLRIQFKWPNDLFLNQAKVGGILIETQPKDSEIYALVGIGINLDSHPILPPEAGYQATSLSAATGISFLPEDILSFLTVRSSKWLETWASKGFSEIRSQWLRHALGLGQLVTLKTSSMAESGFFVDISAEGGIVISQENNPNSQERKTYYAGVAHLHLK